MNTKKVFHILGFIFCLCLVFGYLTRVFLPKSKGELDYLPKTKTFYDQPKNTIDVLFFGDSTFRNGISPLILWQTAGITSYVRATSRQDPMVAYYYLLESLEYQTPKVVVLEGQTLFLDYSIDGREIFYREAIDTIRLSAAKVQLIFQVIKGSSNQTASSYLFPLLRFHTRWKELAFRDLLDIDLHPYDYYRGHGVVLKRVPYDLPDSYMAANTEMAAYNEYSIPYHERIIQVCKQKQIEVMYLDFPLLELSSYAKHNAGKKMAEKHGLLFLDYSVPEVFSRVGFDPSIDMWDINHINSYGAAKFSRDLANLLDAQFDLPDRRNEVGMQQWDSDLKIFLEQLSQDE